MKRNIRILIAVMAALVMGLSGCVANTSAPAVTPAPTAAPAPAETPEAAPQEAVVQEADAQENAATMVFEEKSAYDSAAFDAAAQAVRNEFIQVIQEGIDNFNEDAHPELPWYTAVLTRFPENSYYDAFHDFDGNGVPEMIVAVGDDNNKTPIAVYAFDGQQMRYLCKDHPLGERAYLSRADGLFVVHGSGGAASGELAVYRIAPDGYSTEMVDVIVYEYSDADHVTYTPQMGNISLEEITSRGIAEYSGLDVEPVWNRFYP